MSNMGITVTEESHVTTVTAAMSPYTPTSWDRLLMLDCTDGPITVNLPPAAASVPKRYDFKKVDATANVATIMPDGSDTIDGAPSRVLSFQWQTFGSLAIPLGWVVNYTPMILAADGEVSAKKAVAVNDSRLTALPTQYVAGLRLTWLSATQVSVGAGQARDSTDGMNLTLPSADTADVTDAGDRDFAPGALQWIYVYVIGDFSGSNPTRTFLSLSASSPTLPSGYNHYRGVGVVRAQLASTFLRFSESGDGPTRDYVYVENELTTRVLTGGNAVVFTSLDLSAFVPPGTRLARLSCEYNVAANTSVADFRVTGSGLAGPTVNAFSPGVNTTGAVGMRVPSMDVATDGAQTVDYKVSLATELLHVSVAGFRHSIAA